ncbi:MAG: hypothetical protein ACUVXI_17880 [bacterium]
MVEKFEIGRGQIARGSREALLRLESKLVETISAVKEDLRGEIEHVGEKFVSKGWFTTFATTVIVIAVAIFK